MILSDRPSADWSARGHCRAVRFRNTYTVGFDILLSLELLVWFLPNPVTELAEREPGGQVPPAPPWAGDDCPPDIEHIQIQTLSRG